MAKKLVAYFFSKRVTAKMAKALAEVTGADLLKSSLAVPYTNADLDWMNKRAAPICQLKEGKRFEVSGQECSQSMGRFPWECDTHNKIHDHRQSDIAYFLKEAVYRFFCFYNNIKY